LLAVKNVQKNFVAKPKKKSSLDVVDKHIFRVIVKCNAAPRHGSRGQKKDAKKAELNCCPFTDPRLWRPRKLPNQIILAKCSPTALEWSKIRKNF